MLAAYKSTAKGLTEVQSQTEGVPEAVTWIDLHNPTREEEVQVEGLLGIDLPTREEMAEIEDSSRFYQDGGALYLTATVMTHSESEVPSVTDVTFALAKNVLVTLRYDDPRPFRSFISQVQRTPAICTDGETALLGSLDACLDRIADLIEKASGELDQLVHEVLTPQFANQRRQRGFDYATLLRRLERNQTIVAKARASLLSLDRLTSYVSRRTELFNRETLRSQLITLTEDVRSLKDHTNYLGSNIGFELQAILGMVSIEQNNIIKIFSVAAVVFLPPTLVASIYGMNFDHMPELAWLLGYPMALAVMVCSAILPYLWFKRSGWL